MLSVVIGVSLYCCNYIKTFIIMAFRSLMNLVPRCVGPKNVAVNGKYLVPLLRHYSTINDKFDPPYLEAMKPKIPVYDMVNVQIKGYDFALVESYQSLVHHIAKTMELDVEDCWATPATSTKVNRYKPLSTVVDAEYNLTLYERNVQVVDLPATTACVFTELIQTALPQGLTVSLHPHTEEHEEIRYVPDYELDDLKTQLDTILESRKK